MGVESIDQQHARMFDIINELHAAMQRNQGREALGDTFRALICYTQEHFAHEEQLMAAYPYDDSEDHYDDHEALSDRVADLASHLHDGDDSLASTVLEFLKKWIHEHIHHTDRKLALHLRRNGHE